MELRLILPLAAVLVAAGAALGETPLPRPRPADVGPQTPAPRIAIDPAEAEAASKACDALFAEGIAVAERVEALSVDNACRVPVPVRLAAVRLADGTRAELKPAAVLRCDAALAVAHWVREDIAPAAAAHGSALARIEVAASYVCRPRNNVAGAVLSEHGRANALDVRAFTLADRRTIAVTAADAPEFLAAIRKSACARFTTVLGPGSDKAHELHLHVDLMQRRGGYRMCQWVLPPN